ncbi:Hypothetical protein POVN_LOCUS608 [uncultured virus]|nr:Hypothetical protein POVN_LOCUS608 [uncultured virus]
MSLVDEYIVLGSWLRDMKAGKMAPQAIYQWVQRNKELNVEPGLLKELAERGQFEHKARPTDDLMAGLAVGVIGGAFISLLINKQKPGQVGEVKPDAIGTLLTAALDGARRAAVPQEVIQDEGKADAISTLKRFTSRLVSAEIKGDTEELQTLLTWIKEDGLASLKTNLIASIEARLKET